ncbi:hypothetical protein CA51_10800 [Rosistilla oblonga]|uniref:hypothetical protein n=1 Tax=Rosistilla oblonga TaxID=2527990 RepID=UPI00118967C7|nr:hypothetical protein [Rosistilla oblonga]QDV11219.1 hypothetical protein CA51_10800 [Rosistilla oblonga]
MSRQGDDAGQLSSSPRRVGWRFSLRGLLGLVVVVTMVGSHFYTSWKLRQAMVQLKQLRSEVGYLNETDRSKLVVAVVPTDEPLTWKIRVRTPALQSYQIAYSTLWPAGSAEPTWYSGQPLPGGESLVTLRLFSDPRDNRWKIITLVRNQGNLWRMATVLSDRQAALFRGSHDAIRGGIQAETVVAAGRSLRVIEEKWFAGDGGLMLFGQEAPDDDIDGLFAELQPLPGLPFEVQENRR